MAAPGEVKCRAVIRVRRGQDPNGVTIRSSNSIQVNGEDGAAVPGAAATVDFVCDPDATQAATHFGITNYPQPSSNYGKDSVD